MQVAFASQNLTHIDAHFGWAQHFVIYDVSAEGACFVRGVRFNGLLGQDGDDRKLGPKMRAVRGCALVFAADVGVTARALLARQDIRAITRFANRPVVEALEDLTQIMRTAPGRWLRHREQVSRRGRRLPR